jgi:hypothetical protein
MKKEHFWSDCESHLCDECSILTKGGSCNTLQAKTFRLEKNIKELKTKLKPVRRELENWEELIRVLKSISKEMKNANK